MKIILVTLLLPILWHPVVAQSDYALKNTSIIVTGTSTLHDWEMKTTSAKGQGSFVVENVRLVSVKDLTLSIPAETLKSGKDAMDKNAYKALNTSKHKTITFQLIKVNSIEKQGSDFVINAEGKLQIAGVTKTITISALCAIDKNGSISCKGEKSIKMSAFDVEPPSFMFGSVKTGDDIDVSFDVSFSKNSIETTLK